MRFPSSANPRLAVLVAALFALAGCSSSGTAPPSFLPGTLSSPRELNLIASDYAFVPSPLVVYPGETILLHIVNAGLEPHEAVIGDAAVQAAWEAAEAATADHPPGPTPVVSVPPRVAGIRVFVGSGQRVDLRWTVPASLASAGPSASPWFVGCHIPGHFAKGMVAPVQLAGPAGLPTAS